MSRFLIIAALSLAAGSATLSQSTDKNSQKPSSIRNQPIARGWVRRGTTSDDYDVFIDKAVAHGGK
jgi:hypothetical protein